MSVSLFPPHLTSQHPPPEILCSQYFLMAPSLHTKTLSELSHSVISLLDCVLAS